MIKTLPRNTFSGPRPKHCRGPQKEGSPTFRESYNPLWKASNIINVYVRIIHHWLLWLIVLLLIKPAWQITGAHTWYRSLHSPHRVMCLQQCFRNRLAPHHVVFPGCSSRKLENPWKLHTIINFKHVGTQSTAVLSFLIAIVAISDFAQIQDQGTGQEVPIDNGTPMVAQNHVGN